MIFGLCIFESKYSCYTAVNYESCVKGQMCLNTNTNRYLRSSQLHNWTSGQGAWLVTRSTVVRLLDKTSIGQSERTHMIRQVKIYMKWSGTTNNYNDKINLKKKNIFTFIYSIVIEIFLAFSVVFPNCFKRFSLFSRNQFKF